MGQYFFIVVCLCGLGEGGLEVKLHMAVRTSVPRSQSAEAEANDKLEHGFAAAAGKKTQKHNEKYKDNSKSEKKKAKKKKKKEKKKEKKKAKKLKKRSKKLKKKLKKLGKDDVSLSSSSSSSDSSSSSSSSSSDSGHVQKRRRIIDTASATSLPPGVVLATASSSTGPPLERSRASLKLKLLGEVFASSGTSFITHQWKYDLNDESRRCFAGFIRPGFSDEILEKFRSRIADRTEWNQPISPKTGEPIQRKTAWMVAGQCKCTYKYGGVAVEPVTFPGWMRELMKLCMPYCGLVSEDQWPNSCNLNLYEDGGMSVGWHADDEDIFQGRQRDCPIISFSLGQTRSFELRLNDPGQGDAPVCKMQLQSGDLCTMEGLTQKYYQHRVPRERASGPRINLTWRWIRKHTVRCPCTN